MIGIALLCVAVVLGLLGMQLLILLAMEWVADWLLKRRQEAH